MKIIAYTVNDNLLVEMFKSEWYQIQDKSSITTDSEQWQKDFERDFSKLDISKTSTRASNLILRHLRFSESPNSEFYNGERGMSFDEWCIAVIEKRFRPRGLGPKAQKDLIESIERFRNSTTEAPR